MDNKPLLSVAAVPHEIGSDAPPPKKCCPCLRNKWMPVDGLSGVLTWVSTFYYFSNSDLEKWAETLFEDILSDTTAKMSVFIVAGVAFAVVIAALLTYTNKKAKVALSDIQESHNLIQIIQDQFRTVQGNYTALEARLHVLKTLKENNSSVIKQEKKIDPKNIMGSSTVREYSDSSSCGLFSVGKEKCKPRFNKITGMAISAAFWAWACYELPILAAEYIPALPATLPVAVEAALIGVGVLAGLVMNKRAFHQLKSKHDVLLEEAYTFYRLHEFTTLTKEAWKEKNQGGLSEENSHLNLLINDLRDRNHELEKALAAPENPPPHYVSAMGKSFDKALADDLLFKRQQNKNQEEKQKAPTHNA